MYYFKASLPLIGARDTSREDGKDPSGSFAQNHACRQPPLPAGEGMSVIIKEPAA